MGSHMMGYGMMGPDYGMMNHQHNTWPCNEGYMYGRVGTEDQKFLDETADLRKEFHNKKFEYFEALRNPKTTQETIANLQKDLDDLQTKIFEKAPQTAQGENGRHGMYGDHGCNW